jgi:hypothetical protein
MGLFFLTLSYSCGNYSQLLVLIFLLGCHYPESSIISDNIAEQKDSLPQKGAAELRYSC